MKTSIFIIVLLTSNVSTNNVSIPLVYGGKSARKGQFPHQARIQLLDGRLHCSASIISHRWILTAKHCLLNDYSNYRVVVGSVNAGSGDQYKIEKGIGHSGDIHRDIAMMKVTPKIKFNKNVKAIQLGNSKIGKGVKVTASGWGDTENGMPNTLKYAHFKTLSNQECNKKASATDLVPLKDTDLCAIAKNKGVCHGDSGSGLISGGKLVGVVSRGIPCAQGYPDVYIRVSHFTSWINKNMKT